MNYNKGERNMGNDKKIPVSEIFHGATQGEGPYIGMLTSFVRFGLCDFKCKGCDSMHAVDPVSVKANAQRMTQEEIFKELEVTDHDITFSGGNPCIHDLSELVQLNHDRNMDRLQRSEPKRFIHVETQGTRYQKWLENMSVKSVVISPKTPCMGETTDVTVYADFIKELNGYKTTGYPYVSKFTFKFVIHTKEDIDWVLKFYNYHQIGIQYSWFNPVVYLSLYNEYFNDDSPNPKYLREELLGQYAYLQGVLYNEYDERVTRGFRFLPQLHVLTHGNEKGK